MGRLLTLPRTPEQMERVECHFRPVERYPDFAARLYLWRQRDAERRERFRRDMIVILDTWILLNFNTPVEGA